MRIRKVNVLLLLLLTSTGVVLGQANAGSDQIMCPGGSVTIGAAMDASWCFSWTPTAGLSDPSAMNPTASPTTTTTYTLTVTGPDFSFKATDNVVVTVLPSGDCCSGNVAVAPASNPTVTNPASSNTCLPYTPLIDYDVCYDPNDQLWHVTVTSLTCVGEINIKPWPSSPNSMTVPNTANPVVGGNVNNVVGSYNRWDFVISDMQDYDHPGGGAGPHWHSTAASSAHEYYHWNTDWMVSCIGQFWPQAETDIENLTSNATTKTAALSSLIPQVQQRFLQFANNSVLHWNNVIVPADTPGGGGGGYAAGTAVLNGLINNTQTFRLYQGW